MYRYDVMFDIPFYHKKNKPGGIKHLKHLPQDSIGTQNMDPMGPKIKVVKGQHRPTRTRGFFRIGGQGTHTLSKKNHFTTIWAPWYSGVGTFIWDLLGKFAPDPNNDPKKKEPLRNKPVTQLRTLGSFI